jgi:hypothetical protein
MTDTPKDPVDQPEEALLGGLEVMHDLGCMVLGLGGVVLGLIGAVAWLLLARKH